MGETALFAEITELRREIAELRLLVAQPARPTRVAEAPAADHVEPRPALTRRGLLGVASAGVAGVAATGVAAALAAPAAAAAGNSLLLGRVNDAGSTTTTLKSTAETALSVATSISAQGLEIGALWDGSTDGYVTVKAGSNTEAVVQISANQGGGASAGADGGPGLLADTMGPGTAIQGIVYPGWTQLTIDGQDSIPGVGVLGRTTGTGTGVWAESLKDGQALKAVSTSTTTKVDAAEFVTSGLGRGLLATATNAGNGAATITGITNGTGAAVWGTQNNVNATAAAVVGWAAAKGRGGQFRGGAAAIRLSPSAAATHPASGLAGDLVLDSTCRLWLCKGGAVWSQIG
jgi:hypothetical protein